MVLFEIAFFLIGLAVLIKGADFFVDSAAKIARFAGISEFVIGLTIVAIGTSLPELAAAVAASLSGDHGLIMGNIVGSNIANIGLVVGISALMVPLVVERELFRKDAWILIGVSALFLVATLNNLISHLEGLLFVALFILYILYFVLSKRKFYFIFHFGRYFQEFFRLDKNNVEVYRSVAHPGFDYAAYRRIMYGLWNAVKEIKLDITMSKQATVLVVSLLMVIVGANLTVSSASSLALQFNVSEEIIGISLIAIGTSLPELSVSLSAVRKGFFNILIGNVVGSNIANILLVGGFAALISPIIVLERSMIYSIIFMILLTSVLIVFVERDWKVKRLEGVALLVLYAIFMVWFVSAGIFHL